MVGLGPLLSVTQVTPVHLHIHLPLHITLPQIDISEASSDLGKIQDYLFTTEILKLT